MPIILEALIIGAAVMVCILLTYICLFAMWAEFRAYVNSRRARKELRK